MTPELKYPEQKTLRDEFAMAALTGLLAHSANIILEPGGEPVNMDDGIMSRIAYNFADVMLNERNKGV